MLTFKQALASKTVRSIVGAFIFNGFQAVAPQVATLGPKQALVVNLILGAIGVYGRVKPVQGV